MNSAFICARCERHRLGQFAAAASEGVVCSEGACKPRDCRCKCCDQHCDSEACEFFKTKSQWSRRVQETKRPTISGSRVMKETQHLVPKRD